jgi:hypothetical protein
LYLSADVDVEDDENGYERAYDGRDRLRILHVDSFQEAMG